MSQYLNVQNLVDKLDLNQSQLADILFPDNRYPAMAFKRVLKGEALLNSDQIVRLSEYSGISIEDLFNNSWRASSKKDRPGFITYERNTYKAELNLDTWTTVLVNTENGKRETLIHGSNLALSDYLEKLDETIKNKL